MFDFGLATCVKKRSCSSESYELTGYTGTRAYMAPEVALRRAYNEKVDIYSFGILLWQILTGMIPFQDYSKEEHMKLVVIGGQRPPLVDIDGPGGFCIPTTLAQLLQQCWHADPNMRPSSSRVLMILDSLLRPPSFSDGNHGGSGRYMSIAKMIPTLLSRRSLLRSKTPSVGIAPSNGLSLKQSERKSSLNFGPDLKDIQESQQLERGSKSMKVRSKSYRKI